MKFSRLSERCRGVIDVIGYPFYDKFSMWICMTVVVHLCGMPGVAALLRGGFGLDYSVLLHMFKGSVQKLEY